jgi:hypothetical protein
LLKLPGSGYPGIPGVFVNKYPAPAPGTGFPGSGYPGFNQISRFPGAGFPAGYIRSGFTPLIKTNKELLLSGQGKKSNIFFIHISPWIGSSHTAPSSGLGWPLGPMAATPILAWGSGDGGDLWAMIVFCFGFGFGFGFFFFFLRIKEWKGGFRSSVLLSFTNIYFSCLILECPSFIVGQNLLVFVGDGLKLFPN